MATAPSLPFTPSKQASEALITYCKQTVETAKIVPYKQRWEYIDQEFYRTNLLQKDALAAQMASRVGDKRKLSDIVMPLVEPQIETGLAYLTSVFLSGFPIFGVVSPQAASMPAAKGYEAIIAENQVRGSWVAEFLMFFRDGLKYNFHGMEVTWDRKTVYSPAQQVTAGQQNSTKVKEVLWEGNCLKRMDPYNTFFDVRVPPHKMHEKGEFAGYVELFSRVALKQFLQDLPTRINVTDALKTGMSTDGMLYYIPKVNPWENYSKERLQGVMNWDMWAFGVDRQKIDYKNLYEVVTRYVRIIPSDFSMPVPRANQPQVWKIITVNDQVIVYCERQTNAHNFIPIVFGQPFNDGLGLQSKGLGEKLIPLQDVASASWNARLAVQRRKVSDRGIYDPSRIRPDDVNSDNPSAKIPVKASAYGKPVQDAYHAIPFEDRETGSFAEDAQGFARFADGVSGQNPAQQGQFVKGNKTKVEYEDVQGHSSGRQQTQAIFIESQTMTPIKEMIKLNILQYQPNGPVVNPVDGQTYQVDVEQLRKLALQFQVSDGLLPTDKIIDDETLQVAIQTLPQLPSLANEYDIGGIFNYLLQLRGNVDFSQFKLTPQQQQQRLALTAKQTAAETPPQSPEESAEAAAGQQ